MPPKSDESVLSPSLRFNARPEDLEHCDRLLRAGSKSFALASRLLPKPVRDRTTVLYAFCRVSDDRIDDDPGASQRTIDSMRERLRLAYAGRPYRDDPVDRALAGLLEDTAIPPALPEAMFEGMEWDLSGRRYETLEDLEAYAARVAGTVGAMMTLIMMRASPSTSSSSSQSSPSSSSRSDVLARACDLGVAMQLTNVARDVGEDARRKRIYLPTSWMRDANLDVDEWLRATEATDAIRSIVERLLRQADALYERADHGVTLLPRGCRVAIRAARLVYSDIGRSIANAGFDSVSRRAVVPTWRKLWLLARAFRASWGATAATPSPALFAPPLHATRALVAAASEIAS